VGMAARVRYVPVCLEGSGQFGGLYEQYQVRLGSGLRREAKVCFTYAEAFGFGL